MIASVADNVAAEASKTSAELRGLKDVKVAPSTKTANGQQLTRTYLISAGFHWLWAGTNMTDCSRLSFSGLQPFKREYSVAVVPLATYLC